jgi:hypothetical protein
MTGFAIIVYYEKLIEISINFYHFAIKDGQEDQSFIRRRD